MSGSGAYFTLRQAYCSVEKIIVNILNNNLAVIGLESKKNNRKISFKL